MSKGGHFIINRIDTIYNFINNIIYMIYTNYTKPIIVDKEPEITTTGVIN